MRLRFKVAIGIGLGAAGYFAAPYIVFIFFAITKDCSSTSPAVAKARALSQKELAVLYEEMTDFSHKRTSDWYSGSASDDELPEHVAALQPGKVVN